MSDKIRFCENDECGSRFVVSVGMGRGGGKKYCTPACRPKRDGATTASQVGVGNPATSDRQYSEEETAWIKACLAYRERKKIRFMDCCDFLEVALALGYVKCAAPPSIR